MILLPFTPIILFVCVCCCIASVVSDSVQPRSRQPTRLPVPGILQARTLEWVAVSFSNAGKWKVKVKSLSRVRLFAPILYHLTKKVKANCAPVTMLPGGFCHHSACLASSYSFLLLFIFATLIEWANQDPQAIWEQFPRRAKWLLNHKLC